MKRRHYSTPEEVMMACSTVKASYQHIFTTSQLKSNIEYSKICLQLEQMKKKHPTISVTLFGTNKNERS